jgi:hypothetical protein
MLCKPGNRGNSIHRHHLRILMEHPEEDWGEPMVPVVAE